jgi:hypothetical protein
MSEKAQLPGLNKVGKMRSYSHFISLTRWNVFGLADKVKLTEIIKCPSKELWALVICEKPNAAGHAIYKSIVNVPGSKRMVVNFSGKNVFFTASEFDKVHDAVTQLYNSVFLKNEIERFNFPVTKITKFGMGKFRVVYETLLPFKGENLLKLSTFLTQKDLYNERYT